MKKIPLRLLWLLEHLRCQEMTNKRHGTALQLEMSAQDKISQNSEHSASQPQWALICMPITFYSSQLEEIRWKVQPEATYWTRFCWTMVRLFHPEDIFCVRDEWLVWTRRFCETLSASATAEVCPGLKSSSLTFSQHQVGLFATATNDGNSALVADP